MPLESSPLVHLSFSQQNLAFFAPRTRNLEKTLQRAGGTLKDIVWMTVSVSDGRYSQRFTDIRKEIYGKEFPASTLLTAAALPFRRSWSRSRR
jgi:enamine deaminase RidA (YjgF/YER057c/UK114 family)